MDQLIPLFPFLIPIVAIIGGITVALVAITLDFRRRSQRLENFHKERMLALERGIELPPLPAEGSDVHGARRDPHRALRGGLVLLFVGLAIAAVVWSEGGAEHAVWGLIPASLGAANLLYYAVVGRKLAASAPAAEADPPQR